MTNSIDDKILIQVIKWLDNGAAKDDSPIGESISTVHGRAAIALRQCLSTDHPLYLTNVHAAAPKAATRDANAKCPDCSNVHLYTNVYDKCYECGRNIH